VGKTVMNKCEKLKDIPLIHTRDKSRLDPSLLDGFLKGLGYLMEVP
jgi:hypothetical protein